MGTCYISVTSRTLIDVHISAVVLLVLVLKSTKSYNCTYHILPNERPLMHELALASFTLNIAINL